jgi:membrane-associated protease RseP (regulator of RpoE activity)
MPPYPPSTHHPNPHKDREPLREGHGVEEEPPELEPPASPRGNKYLLHFGLFVATLITTTYAGLMYVSTGAPSIWMGIIDLGPDVPMPLLYEPFTGFDPGGLSLYEPWNGLYFSATLMFILLCHEMGHYVAARIHKVDVSLPFFIPFPFGGLGTFGAVISMREQIKNRNALMDIGAAGPLAGLVVTVPLLAYGLWLSDVSLVPPGAVAMSEGNSIFYLGLKYLVKGELLPWGGRDVFLHPIAWAAWCGLLITMINLIPVWQLDGGHVAFAYFGSRYEWASRWFHKLLPVVGISVVVYVFVDSYFAVAPVAAGVPPLWLNTWYAAITNAVSAAFPWFLWPALLLFMLRRSGGRYHPPVDLAPLSGGRRAVGLLVMIVFVLIFMPIPLRVG